MFIVRDSSCLVGLRCLSDPYPTEPSFNCNQRRCCGSFSEVSLDLPVRLLAYTFVDILGAWGKGCLSRLIIKNPQLKPGVNSSLKETGMKRCYPNLPDVEAIKKAA